MALFSAPTAPSASKLQMVRALRHRSFRWFWFGAIGQATAHGMQFLILGWLVLDLTDSASQLGLVFFLYGIPNLCLILLSGIVADRVDRRLLLILTQTAVGLVVLVAAALTFANLISMTHVYGAAIALGTLQSLSMPARMAIVANLVEQDDLMNAVSLNSAVMNAGRIIGPAIAGWMIELLGIGHALYLNAGCYLIGVAFLLMIRLTKTPTPQADTRVLQNLSEGLRHYWRTPAVFGVISMGFAFGLFGASYMQVLPAFAKEVLDSNAGEVGLLIAASGVGSLLGSLVLASLGNSPHKIWLFMGSSVVFSVCLFMLAWSPWYWVSCGIMLGVGVGFTGFVSLGTTVVQLSSPPELHGRVMSLLLLAPALHFVGALPMGVVADTWNWPIAFAGGAALFMLALLGLGLLRPSFRSLKI